MVCHLNSRKNIRSSLLDELNNIENAAGHVKVGIQSYAEAARSKGVCGINTYSDRLTTCGSLEGYNSVDPEGNGMDHVNEQHKDRRVENEFGTQVRREHRRH